MSKKLGYCIPCGEAGRYTDATVVVDGDQMCDTCLRCMQMGVITKLPDPVPIERAMLSGDGNLCGRGCGATRHRGLCKGQQRPATVKRTELVSRVLEVKEVAMDHLKAEVVGIDEVPQVDSRRPPMGRIGQLWTRFIALDQAKSLKVECRDLKHCGITSREMRKKAAAARVELRERRVGAFYYCWKG